MKKTIFSVYQTEGAMMAIDVWCERYINFPIKIRYFLLFKLMCWYGQSKIGKRLNRK